MYYPEKGLLFGCQVGNAGGRKYDALLGAEISESESESESWTKKFQLFLSGCPAKGEVTQGNVGDHAIASAYRQGLPCMGPRYTRWK